MEDGVPLDNKIISCSFPCNRNDPNGPLYWVDHPDDEVDLCVAFSGILHMSETEFVKKFAIVYAQEDLIADQGFLEGLNGISDVLMIGYPIGLYDSRNNKPIARKGITSTQPKHAFEGKKEFLIDLRAVGGSSGSPVYLVEKVLELNGTNLSIEDRFRLIGILYGGYDSEEGVVKTTPVSSNESYVMVDIGIGVVISSVRLLEMKSVIEHLLKGLRRKTSTD